MNIKIYYIKQLKEDQKKIRNWRMRINNNIISTKYYEKVI